MIKLLKIASVLGVLISSLIFMGCSGNEPSTSTNTTVAASATTSLAASTSTSAKADADDVDSASSFGSTGAKSDSDLNLNEMLTYAIEDEYMARSEYEYIIKTFGDVRPFSNIIKAEEAHIAVLKPLLEEYSKAVPADNSKNYVVNTADINESLEAGVGAEVANIAMYEMFLKEDLPDEVRTAFTYLMNASKNHLAAFNRVLGR